MEFTRTNLPEQHYIYVDRECAYGPEIAQAMGSAFGEVFGAIGPLGITPLSMPISVYTGMDPKILRFRGGVIVSAEDAAKVSGPIRSDVLPTDVVTATHVGPYDTLNVTHEALWSHMEQQGIPATMPVWEVYVDDPDKVSPDAIRTEVYRAVG